MIILKKKLKEKELRDTLFYGKKTMLNGVSG